MCRNAPRAFRSSWRPRRKSSAVAPLTTMPIAATAITVPAAIGAGAASRPIAAHASEPIATSSSSELANAARIEARFQP